MGGFKDYMEQNYQIISVDSWERRDFFRFFLNFVDSNVSVSTDIECTGLIKSAKEKGFSPYVVYLFIVHKALNEIENLRYRIVDGEVRLYNYINFEVYIQTEFSSLPCPVLIKWHPDFTDYYKHNTAVIADIKQGRMQESLLNQQDDVAFVSSTPNLYFTSIKHASQNGHNSRPLVNTGKIVKRGAQEFMPIAITVTHALVDGQHIQSFFDRVHAGFKAFVGDR